MDEAARIAGVVTARFGRAVARVEPAPRGWTGETYTVTTVDGARLFAKQYRMARLLAATLPSLPVLEALHRAGVRGLTVPVAAPDGALYQRTGGGVLVLFEHIDGVQTEAFDDRALGDLVGRIHASAAPAGCDPPRETFDIAFGEALWTAVERVSMTRGDEVIEGLRAFLGEIGAGLRPGWAAFERIAERCRATSPPLVITHGDIPWNVMRDIEGRLHLVDWDELLLAPRERDLWFFLDRPALLAAYRAHGGAGALDDLVVAYYVHHRFFEELHAFTGDILDERGARRAESLALLRGPWITGLRRRMAAARVT